MSDDPNETDPEPGRLRTMYEEASRVGAEAQSRVAELERREAFRDAGLDLKNPLQKMAADSYKGELDNEKVREYIDGLGLTPKPAEAPTVQDPTPADEQAALERISQAGAGDGTPAVEPDRVTGLKVQLADAARRGNNQELDRLSVELARATGNRVLEQ